MRRNEEPMMAQIRVTPETPLLGHSPAVVTEGVGQERDMSKQEPSHH